MREGGQERAWEHTSEKTTEKLQQVARDSRIHHCRKTEGGRGVEGTRMAGG